MSTVPGRQEHPHDDLAVYALDASTPEERERVERHIDACGACRDELDGYRRTLALLGPEAEDEPPPGAWEAIALGVRALGNGHHATLPVPLPASETDGALAAPATASGPSGPAAPEMTTMSAPHAPADAPADEEPEVGEAATIEFPLVVARPAPAPVDDEAADGDQDHVPAHASPASRFSNALSDELATHRARHRARRRRMLLVAAAAVLVVVGAVGTLTRGGADDAGVLAAARTAAEAPDAVVATLAGPALGDDVVARVVMDGEKAYVVDEGLADLPDDRGYQVWRIDGGVATSMGMLGGGDDAAEIDPHGGPDSSLAITEEPSDGSPVPSGPIVATGTFSA